MADTRPTPTNLDFWPGVADLVNDYKHILHVLWSSPPHVVDVLGVGRPGVVERLCGATRLDEQVVVEVLRELDRRRLVVLDEKTREVAIRRWVAFHKFKGRWAKAAQDAYNKITSPKIKAILVKEEGVKSIFPIKSKDSSANSNINISTSGREDGSAAPGPDGPSLKGVKETPPPQPKTPRPPEGYQVDQATGLIYQPGNQDDAQALGVIRQHGREEIAAAVQQAAALDRKGRAWPSAVWKILMVRKTRSTTGGPPAWATMGMGDEDPPAAATAGECYEADFEVTEG